MFQVNAARLVLLIVGLAAVFLSFALQGGYANDPPGSSLPSPSALGIFAIAGVAMIALSLFRGRRK